MPVETRSGASSSASGPAASVDVDRVAALESKVDELTQMLREVLAAKAPASSPAASRAPALPPREADEDEYDDTIIARDITTTPASMAIPADVQATLAKSVGKLASLPTINQGVEILFWLSQFHTNARTCGIPTSYLHIVGRTHLPLPRPSTTLLLRLVRANLRVASVPQPKVKMKPLFSI